MKPDGSGAEAFLEGRFSSATLSRDGRRLALASTDTSSILLLDLISHALETLFVTGVPVLDVGFSRLRSDRLYYCTRYAMYRVDFGGAPLRVDSPSVRYFDLTSDDSIVRTIDARPRISPSDRYLATCDGEDLLLARLGRPDQATALRANPYYHSREIWPSWSPDGSQLVFAACEMKADYRDFLPIYYPTRGELWILNDVPAIREN